MQEEVDPVKVKFRSDYYSMLEGGMGSYMPRFGLMHYLACFTLFDGDPDRMNTSAGRVSQRDARAKRNRSRRKYLVPEQSCNRVAATDGEGSRVMTIDDDCPPGQLDRSTPPALAAERPVRGRNRKVRTLPNGLQVVLAESHTFPKIVCAALFPRRQCAVAHQFAGPGRA